MGRVTEKAFTINSADTTASGWINLNTDQENFHVGFAVKKTGGGDAPALNVDGTMQDVLTSATVVSADYFALISAVATSAQGTNVAGEITFPVAAVRLRCLAGASGTSTLNLKVIQTGKF